MKTKASTQIHPVAAPPGNQPWADACKAHPFLRDLDARLLASLMTCAMPVDFKPGELIFREGEMANRFYLIIEGRVQLEAEATDRPGVLADYIGEGDVLGWSWLFPPYIWNFTARAVEPVRAVFLYGTWLREAAEKDHDLGYELTKRIAQVVIQRLQSARRRLELAARQP